MAKVRVIGGVNYVEVERKAKVGDKVLQKDGGYVRYCIYANRWEASHNGGGISVDKTFYEADFWANGYGLKHEEYVVLEPLKPTLDELLSKCTPENRHEEAFVEGTQASEQVIEMLTSLSRKIVSLETQLRDAQGNVEKLSQEVAEANHVLKSPSPWATQEDVIELNGIVRKQAEELANARRRIAKHADRFAAVEGKVEMLIDDVVTVDERSQVLNAINRYYAEVYR
jgi:uncharacterized coiled-coil protein SlyX